MTEITQTQPTPQQHKKKSRKTFLKIVVSLIVIGVVAGVLIYLFGDPTRKYHDEINRIATVSGFHPKSVKCTNTKGTVTCSAKYSILNLDAAQQMLTKSGYTIKSDSHPPAGVSSDGAFIAVNQSKGIQAESNGIASDGLSLEYKSN